VGLLLRDVADEGEFELPSLVRLQQQDDPEDELAEPEQRYRDEIDDRDQAQGNVHHDARQEEEQRLEAVEAKKLVLVIGLYEQKDKPYDGNIGQHGSHVIGQSARGRRGGDGSGSGSLSTAW